MSKIALEGNASGTGTFTIASPNSNSNFTLNLPAASGTVVLTGGAQTIEFAAGSAAAPSITTTGDTNTGIFFPAADTIAFSEGGVESMRVTSAGNLNIGSSTYARRLSVKDATNTVVVIEGSSSGSSNINFADGDSENPGSINYNHTSNYLALQTAGSERMRIDSSGNVGIGTSSPSTYGKFAVVGSSGSVESYVVNTGTTVQSAVWAQNNANTKAGVLQYGSAQGAYGALGSGEGAFYGNGNLTIMADSGVIKFAAGGNTERARISAAGGFSVGTTADPGAGAIYATGNITAYYSDSRLKDVKGNITGALDKVASLNGVYYTNNDVAAQHGYTAQDLQVGLLAQQVEAVLPEVVKAAPFDLDENGNSKSGENYKTVQYERIIPLLVEAIKELRAEVKALKGE